jgi:hypothetical protein
MILVQLGWESPAGDSVENILQIQDEEASTASAWRPIHVVCIARSIPAFVKIER